MGFREQRFSIIPWTPSFSPVRHTRIFCPIHSGSKMIYWEDSTFRCSECGTEAAYPFEETVPEVKIQSKYSATGNTRKVHSLKRKDKKYYDSQGTEINDTTSINDIAQGKTIVKYEQDVPTGDHKLVRNNKGDYIISSVR